MKTYTRMPSPIGELLLVGHGSALTGLYVADHHRCPAVPSDAVPRDEAFADVRAQLEEYFAGDRKEFNVEIDLVGSPFQVTVWNALLDVPYGATESYGSLASRIGRPGAARAVGAANGQNPISVIVPCHRVIGANGTLTGYGWGTERKSWLLEHEGALTRLL